MQHTLRDNQASCSVHVQYIELYINHFMPQVHREDELVQLFDFYGDGFVICACLYIPVYRLATVEPSVVLRVHTSKYLKQCNLGLGKVCIS